MDGFEILHARSLGPLEKARAVGMTPDMGFCRWKDQYRTSQGYTPALLFRTDDTCLRMNINAALLSIGCEK